MGRITSGDSINLVQVSDNERMQILYRYLVLGENQKVVAENVYNDYGDWASMRISVVTRGYGFHSGSGRGKYRNVPPEAIRDFVNEYAPEDYNGGLENDTFDRFLREWFARQNEEEDEVYTAPVRNVPPQTAPKRPQSVTRMSAGSASYKATYTDTSGTQRGIHPVLLLAAVLLLVWVGSKVMGFGRDALSAGKSMAGNVGSYLSAEYEAEIFEYEGLEFIGNQRFNKPSGVCMRLDRGTDYTIGYFDGGELDGYGISAADNGSDLKIGTFENSELNGYAILRCNNVNYVAEFKDGVANGYGYCFANGVEQFVQFKKVSADLVNFKATKLIAERKGDKWVKPNGKTLKVKDDTYKGITWLREGLICIDDVEFYFDSEVNEAFYDSSEAELSWDTESCMYDSILDDEEGTYINYTHGVGMEGKHQYKEKDNLKIYTFSADITNG